MGGLDLRSAEVHKLVKQLIKRERIERAPPWFETLNRCPPSQIAVRTLPIQHRARATGQPGGQRRRRASKLFQPQPIAYEEDQLRAEFFGDHPWELARPRLVLEDDGRDLERADWRTITSPGRQLNGESVIQRQLHLMRVDKMPKAAAYDQARHEFYRLRMREDVLRRVAQEEAWSTGAYFGKSVNQIGMELENQAFEAWRALATDAANESRNSRAAATVSDVPASEVVSPPIDETVDDLEEELEPEEPADD